MECNKCDDQGHIYDGKGGGRSCDCGKYQRLMKDKFKDVKIGDLFAYGLARALQKEQQDN